MFDATKPLDAEAWLQRLGQEFSIGMESAAPLGAFVGLPVVRLNAQLRPSQPYDRKVLTFRGRFEAGLIRQCGVSLEDFEECVTAIFERSYTLSPSAPPLPEKAEEAEAFPMEKLSLLEMLGDELALNVAPFPRKLDAVPPDFAMPSKPDAQTRPNPFAVLKGMKP